MKNSKCFNSNIFAIVTFEIALFLFLSPTRCPALSTNFNTDGAGAQKKAVEFERKSFEESYDKALKGTEADGNGGGISEKKDIGKQNYQHGKSGINSILISNSLNVAKISPIGLSALKFDKNFVGNLPNKSKAKVRILERPTYQAANFKKIVAPAIDTYNKLSYSGKIDFLYGSMQFSDVIEYDIQDYDKIIEVTSQKLGLGVGLAENIKKYRVATGLTDNYIELNFGITGAQVNAIAYIIPDDIQNAFESIKLKSDEWQNGTPASRRLELMKEIIISAADRN
ncbi:MAG: hypothetical protein WCX65_15750 [bacterium]